MFSSVLTGLATCGRTWSCWRITFSCLSWYLGRFSFNARLKSINCVRCRSPVMVLLGFNSSKYTTPSWSYQMQSMTLSPLADPCEKTVIEYSDRSLIVLWPFYDLALLRLRMVKKTLKALQLWFCGEILIRRWSNKYNYLIFQR